MSLRAAKSTRRAFVAGLGATCLLSPFDAFAAKVGDIRRINLLNSRTGERLDTIYYLRGTYLPQEMAKINYLLRDVRAEKATKIDPRLIDIVSATQYMLGHDRPFTVISGFRTPETNSALRSKSKGVARKSYHLRGMAADLRMEGVDPDDVCHIGKQLKCGGVGLYSGADFVHLDSGPVRSWGS